MINLENQEREYKTVSVESTMSENTEYLTDFKMILIRLVSSSWPTLRNKPKLAQIFLWQLGATDICLLQPGVNDNAR